MNVTVKPKGAIYMIMCTTVFLAIAGAVSMAVFCYVCPKESKSETVKLLIVAIVFTCCAIFGAIYWIVNMIRYKLIITDQNVIIKKTQILFVTRQEDYCVGYENIKSLRCETMWMPEWVKYGSFLNMVIIIEKGNGKIDGLPVTHFSEKQAQYIMEQIKHRAEELNGIPVEIIPTEQKNKKKRDKTNN